MCSIKPIYEFVVTDERLDKAVKALGKARQTVSLETAIDLFFELGYGDAIKYDPAQPESDRLDLSMTPVQLVAAAAALAAIAEAGGKRVLNEPYNG